jgi:carboxyl-terminal processing protease
VNRVTILLVLLLVVPAHAQPGASGPAAAGGYDPALVTQVYAAALAFMQPRTLDPVPVPTLTIWGLRGLTALDPNLTAELRNGRLVLLAGQHVLVAMVPPADTVSEHWAAAAVQLSSVAFEASPAVRHAGTQGIIQSFFDEMFNHLDPYSRYVAPRDAAADRARRDGQAGLGLTVMQAGSAVVVQAAVGDGPAALAGVRRGDAIVAIDNTPVRGMDAPSVASLVDGPEGTSLRLSWRGHDGRVRSADLVREVVPPETVFPERQGNLLVVRISGFSHRTAVHLAEALQQGMATGPAPPEGIVLDLRGNRGGLVREAVDSADTLLSAGVVATTAGRDPGAEHIWRSETGELAIDVPVVVLVDGRTASAAEILAAALEDRGRAVVVGSATLGKGLVQTIEPLPDGGELFVTWSRVLAPRGWPIQGLGVLPQVCSSLGEDALNRQLAALADGEQPMIAALTAHQSARAPLTPTRILDIRGNCPAAEGRELDLKAARRLIESPVAYAAALLPPLRQAASP